MYSYNRVIKDEKNISARRREVVVEFIDGDKTLEKDLSFKIGATDTEVKRAFKQFLNEINFVPAPITDIDYTEPEPEAKSETELAREQWDKDRSQLSMVMELVRDGVFTGTEKQITDLQTKVRSGFKVEYLS